MKLTLCRSCGFCFNADFDPSKLEYSGRYEETQGYSPHFVAFARSLASRWVEKYNLRGGRVLEIGCGSMGEFLQFMIDAGAGHAIGIDPALNVERIQHRSVEKFEWIVDFYGDDYAHIDADAVVCRHTLEHIASVKEFMETVRRAIGDRTDTVVLFELPDVRRVLEEVAFWDIYYEHCSYFSLGSLARLFRRTGFEVLDLDIAYEGQYLLIEARPSITPNTDPPLPAEDDLQDVSSGAVLYQAGHQAMLRRWAREFDEQAAMGRRSVIWGAGSKGVSFLSEIQNHGIEYAVDINPTKHGYFMPGTGQEIVAPEFLTQYQPDFVLAMNPVYTAEIQAELDRLGVTSILTTV